MEVLYKETRFVIILLLIIGLEECESAEKVKVKFPKTAKPGDDVLLHCFYNQVNDISIVKWYKSNQEFFRYTEKESPKIHLFPLPGIQVQQNLSSFREVQLIDVSPETGGNFTCEVTTNGPLFTTLTASKVLHIQVVKESPVNIVVPKNVKLFNSTKILCTYNLKDTSVKYVKLLKDGREFYKYVFGDDLSLEIKELHGIALSAQQTKNFTEIELNQIHSDAEGVYKCEVGANNTIFEVSDYLLIAQYSPDRVHLEIPDLVKKGSNVTLKCQFHTDNRMLVTVSWFKGNREFFNYKTNDEYSDVGFPLSGVYPESIYRGQDDRSSYSVLLLKNVSSETGGKYRCEVYTPWGERYSDSENLYVTHYPSGEPTIFVDNDFVSHGDQIHAECASAPSYPPANITWLWNGNQITDYPYQRIENNNRHSIVNGFPVPSTSSLAIRIEDDIYDAFIEGKAKLSCVVTIADDYKKEKSVILEKNIPVKSVLASHHLIENGDNQLKASTYLVAIISILVLLSW